MGGSVNFPVNREGFSTTDAVAELLNAFTFPSIIPLGSDIAALADLPELPTPVPAPGVAAEQDEPGQGPGSRLQGVRALQDSTTTALAAVHRHKNQGAALTAVLVERMVSAAEAEATLLGLDPWQREISKAGVRAEIAGLFTITEGYAGALMIDAATLVRNLPATLAQLSEGVLGWEHAVIIAEETTLLRQAHLPQDTIDAFEQVLLGKAEHATLPSFREKARRARERSYPETLAPKTRRAYEYRRIGISRSRDGMSWFNLYGPSPTIEAIWAQCTATAQAAQGPHEDRTLTQLRADIAAALLLCQTLEANNIHAPAPAPAPASDSATNTPGGSTENGTASASDPVAGVGTGRAFTAGATAGSCTVPQSSWFSRVEQEPDLCQGGGFPDPDTLGPYFYSWQLPTFDDPDYENPYFREPDPRNQPDWPVPGQPPTLTPTTTNSAAAPETNSKGSNVSGTGSETWPPLPTVTPILLVPALSLLGFTDEPAWMSGAGPISIEVAKYLTANAPSFYRVLVDPISNQPLDAAPDVHRLTQAMKTRLLIRDEYCVFPGCNARAVNCEDDHIQAFATGGRTILENLEILCSFHHRLKHHGDDRTRTGGVRTDQSFERQLVHPRAWTPRMTENGIEWTSPAGYHYPPEQQDTQPPVYPDSLKILIDTVLKALEQRQDQDNAQDSDSDSGGEGTLGDCPCEQCQGICDTPDPYQDQDHDSDPEAHPDWIFEEDMDPQDPRWDSYHWDRGNLPEPPARSQEEEEMLGRMSIEEYLRRHHGEAA
ncbi:HNH endonuclease signature motif containing protein [Arthrobacter sp. HY1533]|uniref:HNH endonuclease signature motif containing protein n=1 Tax=Arthrobacter sp. HY1533 TaxID=2970919 RepID=UPI0022BA06EF|nr:HNH endonuclease signature motif containing protein [Arthrobacter sp. HY1533]